MKNIIKLVGPVTLLTIVLAISSLGTNEVEASVNINIKMNLEEGIKKENVSKVIAFQGKITEIDSRENSEEDIVSILVQEDESNPMDGMIFKISNSTLIFSDKTQDFAKISELREGMKITGYYNDNTPMTMSLPGQLSPDVIIINESEGTETTLDFFDPDFLNYSNSLQLNITDETELVNQEGEEIKNLSGEEDKFLVFYKTTTRSIPAQTTPDKVIIIKEADNKVDKGVREANFKDIKEDFWAKDAINILYKQGLIEGYTDNSFRPSSDMSRREFMFILGNLIDEANAFKERPNEASTKLLDVSDGWGYEEINKVLNRLEIGTTSKLVFDNLDDLNRGITRKEAAYLIDNVIKFSNEPEAVKFKDVNGVTDGSLFNLVPYSENILNVSSYGIFVGFSDNTFRPDKVLTRAEAAVSLSKLLN